MLARLVVPAEHTAPSTSSAQQACFDPSDVDGLWKTFTSSAAELHARDRSSSRCDEQLTLAVALLSRAYREACRRDSNKVQYCSTACCSKCRIPLVLEEHKSGYTANDPAVWVPALWLETEDVKLTSTAQTQIRHIARLLLAHSNMTSLIQRLQRCDLRPRVLHALSAVVRCVFLLPQSHGDAFQLAKAYNIGSASVLGTTICEVVRSVLWTSAITQAVQTPSGVTMLDTGFVPASVVMQRDPDLARTQWHARLPCLKEYDGVELCHAMQEQPAFVLLQEPHAQRLQDILKPTDQLFVVIAHCFRRSHKRRLDVPFLVEHRFPKVSVECSRTASLHIYVTARTSHVIAEKCVAAMRAQRLEDLLSGRSTGSARCHRNCVHSQPDKVTP